MSEFLWFMGGVVVSVLGVLALAFTLAAGTDDYAEEEEWRHWK